MGIHNLFNKNQTLVVIFTAFSGCILHAASHTVSETNPFQTSGAQELKKELQEQSLLKIYFSGNLAGSKESCGCALNPKGGFERRYNFLKKEGLLEKQRPENTLILDFGNLLFKNENITQFEKKSALQNAEKMIQASNFFHYDALNFGNLDRSLPQDDLQKIFGNSQFPWLASNVFPSSRFGATFKRRLPLKLKNSDVLLLGLSSISEGDGIQGWRSEDPHNVLLTELKNTPATTLPIVLSDLDVNELMKIAADMKRPIIFLGSREMGGWDRPLEIGQALLLHLRHQGQDWGVLKVPTKWDNKQGWYNPSETETLAQRWNDLKEESLKLRKLASSSEKSIEIKNLENKAQELKALAPSAQKDIPFSFETVEMNSSFQGINKVSKYMK